MIDLHTHSILSDGELLPSELVRRAAVKGYKAIAITDHVDFSNIDFVVPRLARVCGELNKRWKIKIIPGCEITHVPPDDIRRLADEARGMGARLLLVHGQTITEPVIEGTNEAALRSGIDILAHPGLLTAEEARLAKMNGVYLEISTRKGHSLANGYVAKMAKAYGAHLLLNTDTHSPGDLVDAKMAESILIASGLSISERRAVFGNSKKIIRKLLKNCTVKNCT